MNAAVVSNLPPPLPVPSLGAAMRLPQSLPARFAGGFLNLLRINCYCR
jgi:hypothetical protein